MKRKYVLDTNIFIFEPDCLSMFEENDLYVAPVTLKEITDMKNREGEVGYSARRVKSKLDEIRQRNEDISLLEGVPLGEGLGKLFIIEGVDYDGWLPGMTTSYNDDYILAACVWLTKKYSKDEVILVTDDVDMSFFANILGVKVQHFRNRSLSDSELSYTGRNSIQLDKEQISRIRRDEGILIPELLDDNELEVNEFVIIRENDEGMNSLLAMYKGNGVIEKLRYVKEKPSGVIAKNAGQRFVQEALLAPASEIPLVIINGPAGTAKTFMSLACGLEKTLNKQEYERILITRANVEMDASYGYLPGSEEEKVGPMMRPFFDNLDVIMGRDKRNEEKYKKDGRDCMNPVQGLFDSGIIRAEAMQYMRGRSISNTFVIIDEAQNCTPNQILSIVSRIGNGSKIVLMGDPNQIDNKILNRRNNGLVFAAKRFKGSKLCAQIVMEQSECVRSPLASEAAKRLSNRRYDE